MVQAKNAAESDRSSLRAGGWTRARDGDAAATMIGQFQSDSCHVTTI